MRRHYLRMISNRMRNRSILIREQNRINFRHIARLSKHGEMSDSIPSVPKRISLLYYSVRNIAVAHASPVAIAPAATALPVVKDRTWGMVSYCTHAAAR